MGEQLSGGRFGRAHPAQPQFGNDAGAALINALENALRQYQLVTAEKELLEKTLAGSVRMLTDILASLDPQAFGQGQLIKEQAIAVAKTLGVGQTWAW